MRSTENELRLLHISERYGFPVLNTIAPSEVVLRLKTAIDEKRAFFTRVNHGTWIGTRQLRAMTVTFLYRISYHDSAEPGEFDGMFVGEEFHGGLHPLLLIPASEVSLRGMEDTEDL